MNDDRLRGLYQAALRAREAGRLDVPLEQVEALAAGRLPEAEALEVADRVLADPELAREFALLHAVHESGRTAAPARRWLAPAALAATIAVAVGSALLLRPAAPEPALVRGGDSTAPVLVIPATGVAVAEPVILAWRPVEGALRYTVEVLDAAGNVAFARELRDTIVVVPAGVVTAGGAYRWFVTAATPGGDVRSRLSPFQVAPAGR